MGCGASGPQAASKAPNGPPELSGKTKFLACPITAEITHPTTGDTWCIVCFAPPVAPYGLILSARNLTKKRDSLLVKDVTDAQLVSEKEQQKVSMSWNVFFKAIASEIGRMGKGGANATFNPDGGLSIECRISLTGAAAQAKKADTYRCTLDPIPDSYRNLFKYVASPLATYYGKKKTDLIDKPDPTKEKVLGEIEATYAVKQSSLKNARQTINDKAPLIGPLLERVAAAEGVRRVAVARAAILRQMDITKDPSASWLSLNFFTDHVTAHADPMRSPVQPVSSSCRFRQDTFFFEHISVYPDAVASDNPLLNALYQVEGNWEAVTTLPDVVCDQQRDQGIGCVAAYMLYRFLPPQQRRDMDTVALVDFCRGLEAIVSTAGPFFSHPRSILMAGCFLNMLVQGRLMHKLHLTGEVLFTAILAAVGAFAHHDGTTNGMQLEARTFIASLYPEATHQRHAAACVAAVVAQHPIVQPLCRTSILSTLLASLSLFDAPVASTATAMFDRAKEIRDFGRTTADKIIATGAALALCSVCHTLIPGSVGAVWSQHHKNAVSQHPASMRRAAAWWNDAEGHLERLKNVFDDTLPNTFMVGA